MSGGKAFLEERKDGSYLVGFTGPEREPGDHWPRYNGPVAQVSADNGWLYINTDDYEGCAMLNIETLPMLRRALAKLAKQLKEMEHK